ncbi:CLC_0170 family protein [Paenibacillus sp. GYB003]|uniref:CLC_0170 family protein n=1 Tax=Paenibacillus sp. GYB003 TaxID=2994392 RepID=UPI002F9651C4
MAGTTYIGYLNYIIWLFIASGVFVLWIDAGHYRSDRNREKERKAAAFSGWLNISLGVVVLIGSWIYKRYLW